MKFTVIGHACLYIDTGSERILVDPWLSGSCYWRSWWHFPPNTAITQEFLEPNYVFLSHHHFDHFHYPSLRRISKAAQVLVPRFAVDVMRFELDHLGFKNITELHHGEPTRLPSGTRVASFQYGPDDSAFIVERDGIVLADLNDCKIKGPAVRPMLKAFGNPTFIFKSHSFAQAYPNCYNIADPADADLMTREDFIETFIDAIRELRPKYAIPFASMVAFLHPESRRCNIYAVRPPEVTAAASVSDIKASTETVLMVPGDTWDSASGFVLQPNDYYEKQDDWIEKLARDYYEKIQRKETQEQGKSLKFAQFEKYFGEFLRSLPPFIGLVLRRPIVFWVPSDTEPYWTLDFRRRRVCRLANPPENCANVIRIREAVLMDAMRSKVVAFIHISMRIQIDLAPGAVSSDFLFWGLLSVQELGYFPLRNVMTLRALSVLWRRRIEIAAFLRSLVSFKSFDQRLLGNLMTRRKSVSS
jgi:UDP-MurNAc hydroxylase